MKSDFRSDMEGTADVRPQIFSNISGICAAMSTRKSDGTRFFPKYGIDENNLALPLQCHSNTVRRVDAAGEYVKCDALTTDTANMALAVTVADCVPILLYDPVHKAIGAIHAGWKGTAGEIVINTLNVMKDEYQTDPVQVFAFVGPSAGICCYEVGEEVAVMFRNKIVNYGKSFLDLKRENSNQLQQQGVLKENIEVSEFCTICREDMFHSFRRDGHRAGRMTATICLMNEKKRR